MSGDRAGIRRRIRRERSRRAYGGRILRTHPPDFAACGVGARGFTLIELMMVLTLLLILATMSVPIFQLAVIRTREAVLKDDLYTMRKLIDEFTLDKQRPPSTLEEIVDAGYLHALPVDPFTGSNETWRTDTEDVPLNTGQSVAGVIDVHSGSDETALDGTTYSSW